MADNLIHVLPSQVANQIAAGEVVERPASVVKELVENSLDAGATRVSIRIGRAGKKRIEVEDNGSGMSRTDAEVAMQRHATSKIASAEDLHRIASHGFRGEALPSIASVSRFRLHTALAGESEGTEVRVDGGNRIELRPAPPRTGTRIEVLDLFLNTPARLNFMRTDRTEEAAIVEAVRALALAHPQAALSLEMDGRSRLDLAGNQSEEARVLAVMGREFSANSIEQRLTHEGMQLLAHLGLPTWHQRDAGRMHFLINGRVIRDKQLIAALRAGYRDVMFHDRYPAAVVRIDMDPKDVDVNVHPAKREVRFRSPQAVRAAVVACVRAGIETMGQHVSSQPTDQAIAAMRRDTGPATASGYFAGGASRTHEPSFPRPSQPGLSVPSLSRVGPRSSGPAPTPAERFGLFAPQAAEPAPDYAAGLRLGEPLAQIHQCYILAQTSEGVVLVDQHAAHERITYEKLKRQIAEGALASQMLLTPVPWRVAGETAAWLHDHAGALQPFGVEIEPAGDEAFTVRAVPALLSGESPLALIEELVEACMLIGVEAEGRGRVLERWLGNRACKGSIKSGRSLGRHEQEALLREMERTPNIGQCNHGRPTYVRLGLNDLERLFGRRE